MNVYEDSEKRGPVDGVSEDQSKIDIDRGDIHSDYITAEDDRRVRWKIDCIVLPVSMYRAAVSLGDETDDASDDVPVRLSNPDCGCF